MIDKYIVTEENSNSIVQDSEGGKNNKSAMNLIAIFVTAILATCLASSEIVARTNEIRKGISKAEENNVKSGSFNMREEQEEQVNLAQILTRASLSSLSKLDAGDFVECYLLTRQAKLKSPLAINPTNTSTLGSSTTTAQQQYVTARKSALGFRYISRRPGDVHEKEKFELTLEYGPQRTGAVMDSEAMPMVSVGDGGEGFVSWENEGKVYFETVILSSQWETAVYLCPITGAVLSKILDLSLEFITGHPRYQPFEVFDFATQEVILRSSSSDDFVWKMLEGMAKMYVDITPILIPPKRKLRLYVNGTESVQKMTAVEVRGEDDGVAQFYEKFYQCTKALVTGDNSYFEAIHSSGAAAEETNDNNSTRRIQESISALANLESPNTELPKQEVTMQEETTQLDAPVTVQEETVQLDLQEETAQFGMQEETVQLGNPVNAQGETVQLDTPITASDQTLNDTVASSSPSQSPSAVEIDQAAIASAEASAREAAAKEAAAKAAKEAAAAAALQSLYSGDGDLITFTLTPCLINSTIFLFIDGASYFQMKLVEPYWEAISLHDSVPPPTKQPEGKGDFLDWFLVLFLSAMLLFGVLLALNRMGCAIFGKKNHHEIEMAEHDHDHNHPQFSIPPSMADYSPKSSTRNTSIPPQEAFNTNIQTREDDDDSSETQTTSSSDNRRNPDHVLLPGLRQTSRVAVPHKSPIDDCNNSINSIL